MLKIAQENHSIDYIFGSDSKNRIIPKNHQDFDNLITKDQLNQQIYEDIADILGVPVFSPPHSNNTESKLKRSSYSKFLILIRSIKEMLLHS